MAEKSRVLENKIGNIVMVIHDIRSAHNVGALFRTADAVGVTGIILSGFSPLPIDRFGRNRPDIEKAALGAEKNIPWEHVSSVTDALAELRDAGYVIIGLEQDPRAIDYKQVARHEKMVFVVGTETVGMSQSLRDACDVLCEIPMKGMKESLNVSVATGILLYRVLDTNFDILES